MRLSAYNKHEIGELCRQIHENKMNWQLAKLRIIDMIENEIGSDCLQIIPIEEEY